MYETRIGVQDLVVKLLEAGVCVCVDQEKKYIKKQNTSTRSVQKIGRLSMRV